MPTSPSIAKHACIFLLLPVALWVLYQNACVHLFLSRYAFLPSPYSSDDGIVWKQSFSPSLYRIIDPIRQSIWDQRAEPVYNHRPISSVHPDFINKYDGFIDGVGADLHYRVEEKNNANESRVVREGNIRPFSMRSKTTKLVNVLSGFRVITYANGESTETNPASDAGLLSRRTTNRKTQERVVPLFNANQISAGETLSTHIAGKFGDFGYLLSANGRLSIVSLNDLLNENHTSVYADILHGPSIGGGASLEVLHTEGDHLVIADKKLFEEGRDETAEDRVWVVKLDLERGEYHIVREDRASKVMVCPSPDSRGQNVLLLQYRPDGNIHIQRFSRIGAAPTQSWILEQTDQVYWYRHFEKWPALLVRRADGSFGLFDLRSAINEESEKPVVLDKETFRPLYSPSHPHGRTHKHYKAGVYLSPSFPGIALVSLRILDRYGGEEKITRRTYSIDMASLRCSDEIESFIPYSAMFVTDTTDCVHFAWGDPGSEFRFVKLQWESGKLDHYSEPKKNLELAATLWWKPALWILVFLLVLGGWWMRYPPWFGLSIVAAATFPWIADDCFVRPTLSKNGALECVVGLHLVILVSAIHLVYGRCSVGLRLLVVGGTFGSMSLTTLMMSAAYQRWIQTEIIRGLQFFLYSVGAIFLLRLSGLVFTDSCQMQATDGNRSPYRLRIVDLLLFMVAAVFFLMVIRITPMKIASLETIKTTQFEWAGVLFMFLGFFYVLTTYLQNRLVWCILFLSVLATLVFDKPDLDSPTGRQSIYALSFLVLAVWYRWNGFAFRWAAKGKRDGTMSKAKECLLPRSNDVEPSSA